MMARGFVIECVGDIPWGMLHPGWSDWTKSGRTLVFYDTNTNYWPAGRRRPAADDPFIMAQCARACAHFGVQAVGDYMRLLFPWGSSFHPQRVEPWGLSGEVSPEAQHARLYVSGSVAGVVAVSAARLLEAGVTIIVIRAVH